jgi:hypothetical protein
VAIQEIETGEAADQMIAEVLDPFLEEMRKYQKLDLDIQAWRLCKGLLIGHFRFGHKSTSAFKDWAPDSITFFAKEVVDTWRSGSQAEEDSGALKKFINEELASWNIGFI